MIIQAYTQGQSCLKLQQITIVRASKRSSVFLQEMKLSGRENHCATEELHLLQPTLHTAKDSEDVIMLNLLKFPRSRVITWSSIQKQYWAIYQTRGGAQAKPSLLPQSLTVT